MNFQQRKARLKRNLRGVTGATIGSSATGAGLGYGLGLALSKESNSFKRSKAGTIAGLGIGAAVGGINKYRQNAMKNTVKIKKPKRI